MATISSNSLKSVNTAGIGEACDKVNSGVYVLGLILLLSK